MVNWETHLLRSLFPTWKLRFDHGLATTASSLTPPPPGNTMCTITTHPARYPIFSGASHHDSVDSAQAAPAISHPELEPGHLARRRGRQWRGPRPRGPALEAP